MEVPDCADVSGQDVRALVALEVAPRPVAAADGVEGTTTHAWLECLGDAARMWVADPARSAPLQVSVTLGDLAPAARPRLLALAMAELIATSRLRRPQPTAADAPEPLVLQLWLGAGAAREGEPAWLAPAIALGAVGARAFLALTLDVRATRGERTTDAASLTSFDLSVAAGTAWRLASSS
ncbi:MAG: hypothetical protein ABW321_18690, partial [Polyangiales bacterium]